jgi:hypothetical protein
MNEPQVRAIFARLSDTEAPPTRMDIGLARLNGRRKLRRRRAAMSGTPAAVIGVLAFFAGGILPAWSHGQHRVSPPAASPQVRAVRNFSPLVPYAVFGWLPAKESLVAGNTGRVSQYYAAGPNGRRAGWSLTAISEGRCNLSSGQIARRLHHGGQPELLCNLGPNAKEFFTAERQAPSVNGHIAFRDGQRLAWEYARGSWAVVLEAGQRLHPGLMAKVAAGITFGHLRQPALEFPTQLTGLPAGWQVGSVHFAPDAGVMRGHWLNLAGAGGPDQPNVDVALAGPGRSCYFYPNGQSQRRAINGIKVVVTNIAAVRHDPATYQVCTAHADGLFVLVSTYGQERPRAVSIFRHNLRLLGRDPGSWTTKPLG